MIWTELVLKMSLGQPHLIVWSLRILRFFSVLNWSRFNSDQQIDCLNQFWSVLRNRYIGFIALICPMGRSTYSVGCLNQQRSLHMNWKCIATVVTYPTVMWFRYGSTVRERDWLSWYEVTVEYPGLSCDVSGRFIGNSKIIKQNEQENVERKIMKA